MSSDRIILDGMQFYGYHGGSPEERSLGQPFRVDMEVFLDLTQAGEMDDLSATVSYTHIYRMAKEVMDGQPRHLLESLANRIAEDVLAAFPVQAVKVRVTKTRPPIKGAVVSGAAVEVLRERRP